MVTNAKLTLAVLAVGVLVVVVVLGGRGRGSVAEEPGDGAGELAAERDVTSPPPAAAEVPSDVVLEGEPTDAAPNGDARADDGEVGRLSADEAAGAFALALFSWSYEQPEADRVGALEPLVTPVVFAQLTAPSARWGELDRTRVAAEEVAASELSYVQPEDASGATTPVRVQVLTHRADRYGTVDQRFTVELDMVADGAGGWLVGGLRDY